MVQSRPQSGLEMLSDVHGALRRVPVASACHFGSLLGSFWLPWGSRWCSFGFVLAPFGSLLVIFGSLLAPVGSLLVAFGALWLPFGPLLVHFGSHSAAFFEMLSTLVLACVFSDDFWSNVGDMLASFLMIFGVAAHQKRRPNTKQRFSENVITPLRFPRSCISYSRWGTSCAQRLDSR